MIFSETAINLLATLATAFGTLSALSGFAQAHKMYQNKSSKDVSYIFLGVLTLNNVIWILYGIGIENYSIIITTSIALTALVLANLLYFRYREKKQNERTQK
jgi:uncharacterized protein with PQ loop repeat